MSPKPARRKAKSAGKASFHRRSGVLWRPTQLGVPREPRFGFPWTAVWENDGGDDAPLSTRGRTIFRSLMLGIFVVFVVLVLATAAGH